MNKKLKQEILSKFGELTPLQRIRLRIALDPWYIKVLRWTKIVDAIYNMKWYNYFKNKNSFNDQN